MRNQRTIVFGGLLAVAIGRRRGRRRRRSGRQRRPESAAGGTRSARRPARARHGVHRARRRRAGHPARRAGQPDRRHGQRPRRTPRTAGVRIDGVDDDSPAAKAGLREGDVVVEFDGERVRSARQLTRLVQETPDGRAVKMTVTRGDARQTVEVTPEAAIVGVEHRGQRRRAARRGRARPAGAAPAGAAAGRCSTSGSTDCRPGCARPAGRAGRIAVRSAR